MASSKPKRFDVDEVFDTLLPAALVACELIRPAVELERIMSDPDSDDAAMGTVLQGIVLALMTSSAADRVRLRETRGLNQFEMVMLAVQHLIMFDSSWVVRVKVDDAEKVDEDPEQDLGEGEEPVAVLPGSAVDIHIQTAGYWLRCVVDSDLRQKQGRTQGLLG